VVPGNRGPQDQGVSRPEQRQQVVDRGSDLAEIALDMRERGRPDRDHDVVRLGGVGGSLGQLEPAARPNTLEQRLGARLLPRHPSGAQRLEHRRIVVDTEHARSAVSERQRQRKPDAPEADDRDEPGGGHVCALKNVLCGAEGPRLLPEFWRRPSVCARRWDALGEARQRLESVFGRVPANLPRECDAVEPHDLPLALDPRRVLEWKSANQRADPFSQLQREVRGRRAHQLAHVLDCDLVLSSQAVWMFGLTHFWGAWGTTSRSLSVCP
jgi:hypothetical protein